jgi:PAS domain S-box-containing protein
MQRGPDIRAVAALVIALTIIVLSALLNRADMDRVATSHSGVEHGYDVKLRMETVLAALDRAEACAQGYQLTGREEFARGFREARGRLTEGVTALTKTVADDAVQAASVREMASWADLRLQSLEAALRKPRGGMPPANVTAGLALRERVREKALAVLAAQDRLMEVSARQLTASREGTRTTFLVTALLSTFFVIAAFLLVMRILREREVSERRFRDANDRFQLAADAVQGAIYDWNLKTGEIERADHFGQLIGFPPTEVPSTREWWLERIHPDDLPRLNEAYRTMLEKESHYGFEYRVRHRDGHYVPVWDKGVVLRDADGKPVRVVGSTMDISDRIEAERNRRVSDALVEQILESSQDCIAALDLDARLILMNSHGQESLGITDFAARTGSPWVELWAEDDRKMAAAAVRRATEGEVTRFQGCIPARDGSFRWWDVIATPITDADGKVYRVLTIAREFTEAKQAQETLMERQREIEDLNRRLQRAVAESHHRIKNNLQVLVSLVETMRYSVNRTAPPGELERLARHIRGLAVLHDLLTNETRTPNADMDTVPVRGILDRLMPVLEVAAGDRHVSREVDDFRLTLKQCSALALLVNELVSNALKHGAGEASLALRLESSPEGGDEVLLTVEDNGPGFPPDFDPTAAANTGLDLIESIGRWDLGGDIRYETRPKGGGRVTVRFPRATGEGVALPDAVAPAASC